MPSQKATTATPKKTTVTTTTTRTTTNAATPALGSYTHYRFNAWAALMFLSLVALMAIVSVTKDKQRDFREKWCLSMTGISMCLAFLACLGHALVGLREKFISSKIELAMVGTDH
jgi:succinate dehydrogenase hydrophobic anchor subunit